MAGIRTRARGQALQRLYAFDVGGGAEPVPPSREHLVKVHFELSIEPEGDAFASQIVESTQSNLAAIDSELQSASKNWRLDRMSTVDRNILRLATGELMFDETVPTKVIINEAIELAKRFGTTESPAFVNGILDRVAANVRTD